MSNLTKEQELLWRYAHAALGSLVRTVTTEEMVAVLAEHEGEWVAALGDPDRELLWVKSGSSHGVYEDDKRAVFTLAFREQGSGNPSMFVDAPLVLTFAKAVPLTGKCWVHDGGLIWRSRFGDYDGHTLTMVWAK
jgi:hypothetical protein